MQLAGLALDTSPEAQERFKELLLHRRIRVFIVEKPEDPQVYVPVIACRYNVRAWSAASC